MVVGYDPNVEGEDRDRFWNNMDRTLDSIGNEYIVHSGRSKWMDRR